MQRYDQNNLSKSLAEFEVFLGDERIPSNVMSHHSTVADDEMSQFPKVAVDACVQASFFDFFIPEELGGKLHSFDQIMTQARAISRRDLTSAIAIGQTFLGALPVLLFGDDQQKKAVIQMISQGQLGCLALTEKEHGSDILSTQLEARVDGNTIVLTGTKWLINNATRGRCMTVLCRLHERGRQRLSCVFVDKSHVQFGDYENIDKLKTHGIRGADISGIRFNGSRVPLSNLIKPSGPDIYVVLKTLQISRVLCASFSLGAHDNALRTTLEFTQQRVLYRKPMAEIPNVSRLLSEAYCQLLANEALSSTVARCIRHYPEQMTLYSALVKYWVPFTTERSLTKLKTVLGARYYLREEHCSGIFQKNYRDNEVVSLFDGSSQVNLSIISSQLAAITTFLRKGDWVVKEGLQQLYNEQCVFNHKSCFNPDAMQVTNGGRDYILESFLALHVAGEFEGTKFSECTTALHQGILQLVADIEACLQQGVKDPNSTTFFGYAERYAEYICATNFSLQLYYGNTGNESHETDLYIFQYICAGLNLTAAPSFITVQEKMYRQFDQRHLFSRSNIPLGEGQSAAKSE